MDWHHPDGARCATDEAARKRFVEYTHGLMTNYGKIDILWYDVDWPLTPEQWESERMNRMVFELQPDIIVNNRNGLEGDFSTPEQHVEAAKGERAWESCMTLNEGWGYQASDNEWKTPRAVIDNLARCAQSGGNYLLNIGPHGEGNVPDASAQILKDVGRWLGTNGEAIYGTEPGNFPSFGNYDNFNRRGNTLYIHVHFWPGKSPAAQWVSSFRPPTVVAVGGVQGRVLSARLLKTGQPLAFRQDDLSLVISGLPVEPPDDPVTVIAVECDRAPGVDHHAIRSLWPRYKVGMSS
jgi:alpha-L-fucosidase